jgi:nucleotide-binding universal stress UspA family protein
LDAAALFSDKLRAASTLLAVAKTQDGTESLHAALLERRSRHGLEGSEIRVRYGEMAAQILSEQATGLYELVVVAASDDPVSRPNQLSATLLKILQHSDIPLLVIKGESKSLRNILICTAAGEPGKTNVRVGGRLARRLSCRATLLYVMPSGGESSPLVLSHLDRATATLRTLDVQSDTRVITSTRLAEAILTEARQAACDLIVVGSHVPRGNSRLGPETVTAQVLAGADRPVLVVPGEEM